jgi:putative membrane protein
MLILAPAYLQAGWLRAKLLLVAGLIAYHASCYGLMRALRLGRHTHSQRWFRLYNEVPVLFLVAIVVLAVVKPF